MGQAAVKPGGQPRTSWIARITQLIFHSGSPTANSAEFGGSGAFRYAIDDDRAPEAKSVGGRASRGSFQHPETAAPQSVSPTAGSGDLVMLSQGHQGLSSTLDLALLAMCLLLAGSAQAGPPYSTDDPQPVDLQHWEAYVAATWNREGQGVGGDAPHAEVNYGAAPDLQLHMIVPLSYSRPPEGGSHYGVGDLEVGAKYRFVEETDGRPQVGIFPLVELPSGNASQGLGEGHVRAFLPIWLQKSIGKWTTYGGGGYWINPGEGNRNWWFAGWQAQVQLTPSFAPGAEIFTQSSQTLAGSAEARFNVGAILDFGEQHHLLVSAGRAFHGCGCSQAYLAYLLTLGPRS